MKRSSGFTLIELLVVISIIAILASLALPAITGALVRGQMTQTLSNMKQLHLVAQQMALDATTTGDSSLGWPGDIPGISWDVWATNVVPGYMGTNDFAKMLSAPGVTTPQNTAPTGLTAGTKNGRAIYLYNVSETNDSSAVLFTTANYKYDGTAAAAGTVTSAKLPYGIKGVVVFRRGGDGGVLQLPQLSKTNATNLVGGYPGASY